MNKIESERDYYRQLTNELGTRVIRLQKEQTRARREARRSRIIATLIRELYQLVASNIPLDEIGQQFLYIILETLNVDRAALLTWQAEPGRFVAEHTLGYSKTIPPPDFSPPAPPETYHFINSQSVITPLLDSLRLIAGGPYLLWAFNPKAEMALLVSNNSEDQHLHRPFEEADRDIVEVALSIFIEISQRKRQENLAALSRLAFSLATASSQENIFEFIAEEINSITGSVVTSIAVYQPQTKTLLIKHVVCSAPFMAQLIDVLGQSPIGLHVPVTPDQLKWTSTETIRNLANLSEATFGLLPPTIADTLQKSLGIGEQKGLSLTYNGELIGTILIIIPRERLPLSTEMLKIFTHVVSVALQRKKMEDALRESEIHYRTLAENFPNGAVLMFDQALRHTIVEGARLKNFGLSKEMQGKTAAESFSAEAWRLLEPKYRATLMGRVDVFEMPYANRIWEVRFRPIQNELMQVVAGIVIMQDITERKRIEETLRKTRDELEIRVQERTVQLAGINQELKAEITERERIEAALQESELKYRTLIEQIPAVTYIAALDEASTTLYVSPQIEFLSGFSVDEWQTDPTLWLKQIHPDDREQALTEVITKRAANKPISMEYRLLTKAGQTVWIRDEAKVLADGTYLQGVMFDITAQKITEERIKNSLQEKEVLLKEIHHRVKNNLQIISSLLNLQSNYIQDAQALEIFQDSQNRVRTMAMIHEKLYQSKNLAQIDFGDYIKDLTSFLFRAQNGYGRGVKLNLQFDHTLLNIEQAVPCGLLISELVSNALKHAFPNGQPGHIQIEFHTNNNGLLNLIVADNGIGLPPEVDFRATESLGLKLVNALTDQLSGIIALERQAGTKFSVVFPSSQTTSPPVIPPNRPDGV